MTAADAILNTLLDAIDDSAAGYALIADEADGFSLYAHCDFQGFERGRLAALLAARMEARGTVRAPVDRAQADRAIVNLKIALVHGTDAVIAQLQRNDARLSHMLQASMADGQLRGEVGQTLRSISSAVADAQAELTILARNPDRETRRVSQAA